MCKQLLKSRRVSKFSFLMVHDPMMKWLPIMGFALDWTIQELFRKQKLSRELHFRFSIRWSGQSVVKNRIWARRARGCLEKAFENWQGWYRAKTGHDGANEKRSKQQFFHQWQLPLVAKWYCQLQLVVFYSGFPRICELTFRQRLLGVFFCWSVTETFSTVSLWLVVTWMKFETWISETTQFLLRNEALYTKCGKSALKSLWRWLRQNWQKSTKFQTTREIRSKNHMKIATWSVCQRPFEKFTSSC